MTSKPSTTNCPNTFACMRILSDVMKSVKTESSFMSCVKIVNTHTLALAMHPDMIMFNGQCSMKSNQVVIAAGSHLFPFRTEKLSPPAPMVLQCNAGE